MFETEMVESAREALLETGKYGAFAKRCAEHFGWRGTVRQAEARVAHWLSPECPHHLPAEVLPILVEVTGRDPFTPLLLRAGLDSRDRKAALRRDASHERDERRRA